MRPILMTFAVIATATISTNAGDIDSAPIHYSKADANNVISRLSKRLDSGEAKIDREKTFGYLRGLLRELKISESSQVLVFSKTSLQRHRISPRTPRAIYFNDDVYVGFCQNGDVAEISAVDPQLGTVFYTLDQKSIDRAHFTRQGESCLICHASSANQGLPGHLVRSVFPDSSGLPILASGTYRIDQSSPVKQRWGGWYVSGTSGKQSHLGNMLFEERTRPEDVENKEGLNLLDLSKFFKPSNYLTTHSDIVALMVLEHQAQMHNLLGRANIFTRQALYDEAELNKALDRKLTGHTDSTLSRIRSAGEPLVRYMLFSEEAELTDRIQGSTDFAREFVKRGPFDSKGRSLREFDLESRIFKYPCSYLIYSESFRQLPAEVKEYVLQRLWDVLTGKDESKEFAHLTGIDRKNVREILLETLPELPEYWRATPRR